MDTQIKKILDLDPLATLATRGFFTNYPIEDFIIKNDCAVILGRSDHLWIHCVGNDKSDLSELLQNFKYLTSYYYSLESWMLPLVLRNGQEDWRMETLRFCLDPTVVIPTPINKIVPLSPDFTSYVFEHSNYREFTDEEYIHDRLTRDISAAIVKDGKPIAWGFTHDDGALGFLHVLPEFRKMGYARDIVLSRIALKRERGLPVFCNIVPGNLSAINLMESLGFEFDRKVYWLKLHEN